MGLSGDRHWHQLSIVTWLFWLLGYFDNIWRICDTMAKYWSSDYFGIWKLNLIVCLLWIGHTYCVTQLWQLSETLKENSEAIASLSINWSIIGLRLLLIYLLCIGQTHCVSQFWQLSEILREQPEALASSSINRSTIAMRPHLRSNGTTTIDRKGKKGQVLRQWLLHRKGGDGNGRAG